jgi:cupin superfamily acireductone dioxygenase involved in methionine salvage
MSKTQQNYKFEEFKKSLTEANGTLELVSRPLSFKKRDIAWFDPLTQTFNLKELPSEVKNIIKQIGYKKKDLLNPEKAKPVYDIIQKFGLDNIDQYQDN